MAFGVLGPLLPDSITRPSQRRLLSILLLHHGSNIDRDRLIDYMWGHRSPQSARNALQVHIGALRKAIPRDVIVTAIRGYRIDVDGHDFDVSDFDCLAVAAHRERDPLERVVLTRSALELWRGDPYQELVEETFALPEVTRLNETYLKLLELQMQALLALGHNDEAIPQLRELVERHPLRERLHEDLMLALYRSGRQADALRQFRSAQRILGEELGIEPGPALRELEERILFQDRNLNTVDVHPTPHNLPTFTTSFVGRENDLLRARSSIDDRGVVVIAGAAGIGKTAFSDVLADECRAQGGRVLELRGTHGLQRVPFGALAAFVPLEVGDTDTKTVTRATASIMNTGRSGMIVLDDAHLLDHESAALISGIAQSRGARLVITVTSGERLPADITAIWARWPDCRIDLDPLTRDEVGEMAADLLGRAIDDAALDEISSITLGYPLYVAAIAAEVSDRIEKAGEDASTAVKSLLGSSDRLTRLLERRLSRLDREERRLFDAIAFAESIPTDVLSIMDEIGALSRLETSGLVQVGPQYAQVTHPLLATVANETLTLEGRKACARQLLDGIGKDIDPGDVASLVRVALSAGVIPNTEQLEVAADVAMAWRDFTGAAKIAAHAPDDQQLIVLRARALRFLGEVPDEVPVDLDESALTDFLSTKSQAMAYGERRFADAIAMLQEGMASLTESTHRNRLATELLILSGLSGDMDALLGAGRTVSNNADPETRLLAMATTQLAEGLTLSTSSADDTYARGRQIVESMGTDSLLFEQLEMSRVLVDLADGQFRDARVRLGQSEGKAAPGSWLMIEAVMADAWSSADGALRMAESAVSELESFDPTGNLSQAKLVAELRLAQTRRAAPKEQTVEQPLDPAVAEIDHIMSQRAQAWYAWAVDDTTAGKLLIEVGREAVGLGHRFWGLLCFIDAVRLGNGEDVAADIEHLAITRGAGLATMAGHYARSETPGDLRTVARMWWEAGAPTYAIEAAIRAVEPISLISSTRVQLMAAKGAEPVVGDVAVIEQPLSNRQVEIVLSVLGGASNREVADALFVSERTVENHLHRAYQTLDISNGRDGLTDRFGWL